MKVYIAGPMTGYEDWNRPAFHAAAAHLRANGFEVVNPAELDEGFTDEQLAATPHADFLRRDIVALLDCQGIYFLPGSRWSKGATLERTVSQGTGIFEVVEPNVDLWRTFEGAPLEERSCTPACDEMHTFDAGCELQVSPETREFAGLDNDDACHEFTCPAHGEANRRDAEAEALDLLAAERLVAAGDLLAEDRIVVDDTLPANTIRFQSGPNHVDFEVEWPSETEMRLVPKSEDTGGIAVDDDDPHLFPWQQAFARYFFGVLGGRS